MLKLPLLVASSAAILLSGCATAPIRQTDTTFTRTYSDSRASIWQRILANSASRSMFVRQADLTNGVIAVDREIIPTGQADIFDDTIFNWASCGWGGVLGRTLNQRVELNFVVQQASDGRTTVTLNGRFRQLRSAPPMKQPEWVECTSTGVLERELIEALYYDKPV